MFYSILFPAEEQWKKPRKEAAPDCFRDLYLDQIFRPILNGRKEYGLEGFFYTSLRDSDTLIYRQKVMRELEDDGLRGFFSDFSQSIYRLSQSMEAVKKSLTSENSYENHYLTKGRLLDCADSYCTELAGLTDGLRDRTLCSDGLRGFMKYLAAYTGTEAFTELRGQIGRLREQLSSVEYCMLIKNGVLRVRKYEGQEDHSKEILRLFDKFRQGDGTDYRRKLSEEPYAQHVEAAVLNMVASWYKDIFENLDHFCLKYLDFINPTVARFSREIQFYLSWLEYIRPHRGKGLPFCYPKLCENAEHLYDRDGFDLALASSMGDAGQPVTNDFELNTPERIIVVTGPNQGGKTTFARAFGQIHYLSCLGLCVPGREAAVLLFDNIFTHFGREEDLSTQNGKLQDDLERLHELLGHAASRSIIVINEIFSSTTLTDALLLGGRMMDALAKLGAPAVCVTFIDELAAHGEETVSMMSSVREDDPAVRTFRITRRPPDGLAYAMHIAGKYGLTSEQLCERLRGGLCGSRKGG
ncbi:MutS-related protein [Caproiciproducens sp. R2]|uniref:MutS-related protein n=1 Tax=Caproiciproducens sp. R2 TaxID=3435187 RepID=UPI00403420FD